jgi:hypothetical protein
MLPPSFFDHLADRLEIARYDINQEWLMKRRLVEPALIDGVMRPAGYEWEDNTAGPHRRNSSDGFAYHPQFMEVGETIIPFPFVIHSNQSDRVA